MEVEEVEDGGHSQIQLGSSHHTRLRKRWFFLTRYCHTSFLPKLIGKGALRNDCRLTIQTLHLPLSLTPSAPFLHPPALPWPPLTRDNNLQQPPITLHTTTTHAYYSHVQNSGWNERSISKEIIRRNYFIFNGGPWRILIQTFTFHFASLFQSVTEIGINFIFPNADKLHFSEKCKN